MRILLSGWRSLMVMPNSNDLFSFMPEDIEYLNSSGRALVVLQRLRAEEPKQILELLDDDVFVSLPGEIRPPGAEADR